MMNHILSHLQMATSSPSGPCKIINFGEEEYQSHPEYRDIFINKKTGKVIMKTDRTSTPWMIRNIHTTGVIDVGKDENGKQVRRNYHKVMKETFEPDWRKKEAEGKSWTPPDPIPPEFAPFCPHKYYTWRNVTKNPEDSPLAVCMTRVLSNVASNIMHNLPSNVGGNAVARTPSHSPPESVDSDDSSNFTNETFSSINTNELPKTTRRKAKQFKHKLRAERKLQKAMLKKIETTVVLEQQLADIQKTLLDAEKTKDWALDQRLEVERLACQLQLENNALRRDIQRSLPE